MSEDNVRGHRVARETIIGIVLCMLLVALRMYTRIMILRKVSASDYMILVALASLPPGRQLSGSVIDHFPRS